jgi:phage tail sheath protein FI
MTQADIQQGRLVCEVGVAPVRPGEFVRFRIARYTGDVPG